MSSSKAFQEHITSDKHFGEPSSDLDNTTTHLSPHNLNPQHKQLEGNIINENNQQQKEILLYLILITSPIIIKGMFDIFFLTTGPNMKQKNNKNTWVC